MVIGLFALIIGMQLLFGYLTILYIPEWSDRGTFGDMFGAVNTLFSGLAFAGLIYAIYLQSIELSLQREELRLTREELTKSADAQKSQVDSMLKAAKINAINIKIQYLTTLYTNQKKAVYKGVRVHPQEAIETELQELDDLMSSESTV